MIIIILISICFISHFYSFPKTLNKILALLPLQQKEEFRLQSIKIQAKKFSNFNITLCAIKGNKQKQTGLNKKGILHVYTINIISP